MSQAFRVVKDKSVMGSHNNIEGVTKALTTKNWEVFFIIDVMEQHRF